MFKILSKLRDYKAAMNLLSVEEFSAQALLAEKVQVALKRLDDHRGAQFRNRQRYLTAEDRLAEVRAERDALQAKVDAWTPARGPGGKFLKKAVRLEPAPPPPGWQGMVSEKVS